MMFEKLLWPAGIVGTVIGLATLTKDYVDGERYRGEEKLFGRTVIVTGANSGIGEQTSRELAKRGAKVIMACRNMKDCMSLRDEIVEETFNPNIHCKKLDLTSLKSIKEFAEDINEDEKRIHVLINNAGVMLPDQRKLTKDGYEMHLGVNYFGPFLLTHLLLDKLKASAPSRIVNVTCSNFMHAKLDFKNLNFDDKYHGEAAYGQSKLALYLFSVRLAEMLEGTKVSVYAANPGLCYTKLPRNMGWYKSYISSAVIYPFLFLVMKNPRAGMQTVLRCVLDPELEGHTGKYYDNCKEIEQVPNEAFKDINIDRLWATSELWTRLKTHAELVKTQPDVVKSHHDVAKS